MVFNLPPRMRGARTDLDLKGRKSMKSDEAMRLDEGREIKAQNANPPSPPGSVHIKVIAYLSLVMGVFSILGAILAPSNAFVLTFSVIFGLYGIMVFVGLTGFKTWGRIMAIAFAIVMIISPVSWYTLWVLCWSDARDLFPRKAPAIALGLQ